MAETMKLDGTTQLDFDREMVEQAYDRWAPIYDLVFGGVFSKGRAAAIQATNKIGGRVLEVGVGTGISLPLSSPNVRIFGPAISRALRPRARRRPPRAAPPPRAGFARCCASAQAIPPPGPDVRAALLASLTA